MPFVQPPDRKKRSFRHRLLVGGLTFLFGVAALAAPFFSGQLATIILSFSLLGSGLLRLVLSWSLQEKHARRGGYVSAGVSMLAGLVMLFLPKLAFAAAAALLGVSWVFDGIVRAMTAVKDSGRDGRIWGVLDGLTNVLLGVAIGLQWPVTGIWSLALTIAIRNISGGWSTLWGHGGEVPPEHAAAMHPDQRLGLPPHPELERIRAQLNVEEATRVSIDRHWCWMFVLTFFAIHVGRMDAEWNLIGLLSPGGAVLGDLALSLLLAYGLAAPLLALWHFLTRPLERRTWRRYLDDLDHGKSQALSTRLLHWWLVRRMRSSLRISNNRGSLLASLGWGLRVGLPATAILIAVNPIWGISWHFNSENWVTAGWELYAEQRTDDWRVAMIEAVRAQSETKEEDLFQVSPDGVAAGEDFSFIVIGDTGEGDPSQHVLRDRFLNLGEREDVKFLVLSSDVIYPQGALKDYEPKFHLPFKGFTKPIYALPGNHDWYDALDAFTANFFKPDSARVAMRARRESEKGITTTTEERIDGMIAESARLRAAYGTSTGHQNAPYFEIQTPRFALIVVDTGILRRVDADQERWLRGALERAKGKFKMAILGHPLYAGGHYQGDADPSFTALHHLLREHEVAVVMGGDTHDLEYYNERHQHAGAEQEQLHFVNGGGGAYLSIGTALDWPNQPATPEWAHYPRADAIRAKLDNETPAWKLPLWWWVKRYHAWPSTSEAMASAFDFNRSPFFQSFFEVRVEPSQGRVRLLPHGANGQLTWGEIATSGTSHAADEPVEWVVPMPK